MIRRTLVPAALGVVLAAAAAVGVVVLPDGSDAVASAAPLAATTTSTAATTAAEPTVTSADVAAAVDEAVDGAHVEVGVLDLVTGTSWTTGDDAFETASIVKVDVLVALLLQHQADGASLSTQERSLARAMITVSDNDAATTLFEEVGGVDGLAAVDAELGLTGTTVERAWGTTTTTVQDRLRLLQVVFGDDSPLDAAGQAYVAGLMADVEVAEQRFGVTAAADEGADVALKVGYLQRSATGEWVTTSIGRTTVDGHEALVVVLGDGAPSFADGVSTVDAAAASAADAIRS